MGAMTGLVECLFEILGRLAIVFDNQKFHRHACLQIKATAGDGDPPPPEPADSLGRQPVRRPAIAQSRSI
jgi:hypothetical protein